MVTYGTEGHTMNQMYLCAKLEELRKQTFINKNRSNSTFIGVLDRYDICMQIYLRSKLGELGKPEINNENTCRSNSTLIGVLDRYVVDGLAWFDCQLRVDPLTTILLSCQLQHYNVNFIIKSDI